MMVVIPKMVPVMTLPGTVLFPRTVIPLRIFEPRYRHMLRDVLSGDRIFAIAALAPNENMGAGESERPSGVATAGIIRACQASEDGTSHLLLQGLARIRIESIVRETPYRVIEVQQLDDFPAPQEQEMKSLRDELLRAIRLRSKLDSDLPRVLIQAIGHTEDPSELCDLAVHSLAHDPLFKQRMLETLDSAERLRSTIAHFRQQTALLQLQRRLQGRLHDDSISDN